MAIYKVNEDGKAPTGLKPGDQVVTGGGTVTITGVNADGSYKSTVSNATQTTKNYGGSYANSNSQYTGTSGTSPSGKTYSYGENGVRQPIVNTDTNFSGNGASGIYKTTEDYAKDTTDYAALMLAAQSYAEFKTWQRQRELKAEAQGIDLGANGIVSNEDLYNQWHDAYVQSDEYKRLSGKTGTPTTPSAAPSVSDDIDYEALLNSMGGGMSTPSYGSGSYGGGNAPTYSGSRWDDTLDQLMNELLSMNYTDWTKGSQYKALADRYGRQGDMSMRDVLGQISSRTGGLASSYATTAAQQQYNDYMAQLEDAAMEMYGVERGEMIDKAQMAQSMSEDDYNRFLDELRQWNSDRDFNYDAYRDGLADQQYQEKLDQANAMERAEILASLGDFSGYEALGYSPEQIALMQAAYESANSSQIGSGGGGGGYDNGSLTKSQVSQLQELLGVTADGLWGSESKKAAGGMSADEAWAAYGSSGTDGNVTGGDYDYWLGDGTTAGGKTSFYYDQDEGIFTWNGKNYYTLADLENAINGANLTDDELATLMRKMAQFGVLSAE